MDEIRARQAPRGASVADRDSGDQQPTIRSLLTAVNSASSSTRKSWIAFLVLMAYFLVALAGVSHKDLLLNNPVELPFVRISVDLDRFFLLAPCIFLVIHLGFLLQHVVLSEPVRALDARLAKVERTGRQDAHAFRLELHPYFYTQIIAGPWHEGPIRALFIFVVTMTLLLLPISLLVYFQISYLPTHNATITTLHQAFVLLDAVCVAGVSTVLIARTRDADDKSGILSRRNLARCAVVGFFGLAVPFFSLCIATIPDSWTDRKMRLLGAVQVPVWDERPEHLKSSIIFDRTAFLPTAYLFEGAANHVSGKASSWFSRNLIVTDATLAQGKPENGSGSAVSLPGRDLRYATFDRSDFRRANLNGASLIGAKLVGTDLRGARLSCAEKLGSFAMQEGCADLRFADMSRAQLQQADFSYASLQNSTFQYANLRGANLYFANAQGANMSWAQIQGAKLAQSNLVGVSFSHSSLSGADLMAVRAQAASFDSANLQGAALIWGQLQGADLQGALLHGASLAEAAADWADFRRVHAWATTPPKSAQGIDPRGAQLAPIDKAAFEAIMKNVGDAGGTDPFHPGRTQLGVLSPDDQGWSSARAQWNEEWKRLLADKDVTEPTAYMKRVTESLVRMACEEQTEGGYVARGLVARAARSVTHSESNFEEILFNGDPDLFYRALNSADCRPSAKVPLRDMERLRRIAELYRSRGGHVPSPRQKP